jgi:ribosomal protein S6--L-glutamate ligase
MNIVMLSRSPELYSTRRLLEAAARRGHDIRIVDILQCVLVLRSGKPDLVCHGASLAQTDAVLPRIGASVTAQGLAVIRQFEAMGIPTLVPSDGLEKSRNKLRCLQHLAAAGIGVPDSSYGFDAAAHPAMVDAVGGTPLILKLLEGAHGQGVVLADAESTCSSVMDTLRALQASFLAQRFIGEAAGCDLRCFVIGGEVVATMQRRAAEGEFRSNLHRGGTASRIEATPAEIDTAVRAARLSGLPVAGVDILRSARGPLVMEVNSSPGLEGIEGISGIDIADRVIAELERIADRQLH